MRNSGGNPTLTNCIFSGNSASGEYSRGGGILSSSSPTITNCTFIGNSAQDGGAIHCYSYSNPTIINCTFAQNSAANGNALACNYGPSSIDLTNCILADGGEEIWNNDDSTITITYSNIQGGWPGQGNIDADPCFVDTDNGDYHLLPNSPCIDAGDPNYIAGPNETDLDGNPRIVDGDNDGNSVVDMGAFERMPEPAELVAELLEGVGGLELPRGIANSLLAKLDTALQKLEDENENNDVAAINTLGAFINAVEAQRGKKIPEADADALIADAMEIIELLSTE